MDEKKKVCKFINGLLSWVMEVDGEIIVLGTSLSVDYFKKHYSELGYEIKIEGTDG